MHFGATLRLLRIEAGISLRELATRIGVSSAYLSRVETGRDPVPTPDRLIAIADVLTLPRAALVEFARQAGPAVSGYLERTPEANALFLEIARRNLTGPQIGRLKAFIDAEFPGAQTPAGPRLVDLLPRSHIVLRVSCEHWSDLLGIAVTRLGRRVDQRTVLQELMARSGDGTTAIGGGFAAPHAIVDGIADTAVLVTLAQPIHVTTPDGGPLRVVILVLSAKSGRSHLETLARVARVASYGTAEELTRASSPDKVRELIERIESLW